MATNKLEVPVRLTVTEEPSEAIALLKHFLFGEITPERVQQARALLIRVEAWDTSSDSRGLS